MSAAARTKNYSGAELEGVAKSAVSFPLNRQLSMDDLHFILDFGKTTMAATVGLDSDFLYVKIVTETMIGLSESSKCAQIVKVFEDAYRSPLSIIILDDIER
ncbi:hypothetical protein RHGRI_018627 [Rhododendron griersonianum]|uniref:Vesicle-fusing ATPase n=1 Tax=Rhododendron griersonianum TaxID=479676 RepID=A0AAV6K276_9ERIC|nr:hypothetical protein RHGRI_018627 [Rhododendron griersonianum]